MVKRVQCPGCRRQGSDQSGNNLALFEDDPTRGYCFKCAKSYQVNGDIVQRSETNRQDLSIEVIKTYPIKDHPGVSLSPETLQKYQVRCSVNEQTGQINKIYYPYFQEDSVVGYKVRLFPKDFTVVGKIKGLFGQQACKANAKLLVITEGEKDCLAVSEMFHRKGKNWNVVSLPHGAREQEAMIDSATTRELDWIVSHEKVILCLDNDKPGQETAKALAELLASQTAVAVMQLSRKDAAELLINNEEELFWKAFYGVKAYSPESIVEGSSISLETLRTPKKAGYEIPFPKLNKMLMGVRKGEIITITGSPGCGKTQFATEIMYHLSKVHGLKTATIALETPMVDAAKKYVAMDNNVPAYRFIFNGETLTDRQIEKSRQEVLDKMFFMEHWGSISADVLMNKCNYYVKALGVDFILIDHLSMTVAGLDTDERKALDMTMERLTKLVTMTGVGVIAIIHLKRSGQKQFSKGDEIELTDMRGTSGIESMSWVVLGLERDQQSEEASKKDISRVRVLKSRQLGFTGLADHIIYDHETGRLKPMEIDY